MTLSTTPDGGQMSTAEIELLKDAQADLQVGIGWYRLDHGDDKTSERLYAALNQLHDLLLAQGVVMGRHMDAELKRRQEAREVAYPERFLSTDPNGCGR